METPELFKPLVQPVALVTGLTTIAIVCILDLPKEMGLFQGMLGVPHFLLFIGMAAIYMEGFILAEYWAARLTHGQDKADRFLVYFCITVLAAAGLYLLCKLLPADAWIHLHRKGLPIAVLFAGILIGGILTKTWYYVLAAAIVFQAIYISAMGTVAAAYCWAWLIIGSILMH